MRRVASLLAAGALTTGCATAAFTPRTVDCGRLTPVPNPSGRIDLASQGASVQPPQADRWCMSTTQAGAFAFNTHPLMGRRLESPPSQADVAHTVGIIILTAPVPKELRIETPEELAALAQRMMLGESGRFRTVESSAARDSSLGADCVRFDSVVEERDNPRASGGVFVIVNRENRLCRHPHASSPTLVLFGASERYLQGSGVSLTLDTLRPEWEPSVRSVQFLRPR